jgi:hypothetical protein
MNNYHLAGRLCLLFILFLFPASFVRAEDWKPVDPAHLAMKEPVVEKDADAEVIFWEVHINDSDSDLIFNHYIRIKVFTDRGKESQSRVDIPYWGKFQIKDIAGRTIKADGTIVELKKDAIFDREIVKLSGIKIKAKSFAMPAVEAGSIIEYRWREIRPNSLANNLRLQFQREVPVQFVKYYLKPAQINMGMNTLMMNGANEPFGKEKDGYYSVTMKNVPAFHEEPNMPPEDQVRTWMFVYYTSDAKQEAKKYWAEIGKRAHELYKDRMKPNDEVKKAAVTIIGDATTPDEKLKRLFDFCRYKIKNVTDDVSGFTAEDLRKMKENKSPADTLKNARGDGQDIDLLFAALATAAGFEARQAWCAQRDDLFFDPKVAIVHFLDPSSIAVRVGNEWKFFDPATVYVPYGMLRWQEEGVFTLITDPKEPVFVESPMSAPEKSKELRVANLRLNEDGTIEGNVRITYTGHSSLDKKEYNDDDSAEKREENLRDMIKKRMSTAEVTNINIQNVTDPDKPFLYTFHVKVPGYAQRTGKRLFLQPAFFQYGIPALFSASERKYSVYFHYPWSEEDTVIIELPAGFALDNADQPQSFTIEKIGNYLVDIGITQDKKTLQYQRKFFFGGENRIVFPTNSYPTLKRIFDAIHEADNHTITLKQTAAQ